MQHNRFGLWIQIICNLTCYAFKDGSYLVVMHEGQAPYIQAGCRGLISVILNFMSEFSMYTLTTVSTFFYCQIIPSSPAWCAYSAVFWQMCDECALSRHFKSLARTTCSINTNMLISFQISGQPSPCWINQHIRGKCKPMWLGNHTQEKPW